MNNIVLLIVICPRVVHLAFSIWKFHNNPEAAIPAFANKLDNMEPYGRIPMLTHTSHGTGAPAICCKIAKRPRQGKQKLSPRNPPLRKESQGKQLPPCHSYNNQVASLFFFIQIKV
jgi:hypothetical protein